MKFLLKRRKEERPASSSGGNRGSHSSVNGNGDSDLGGCDATTAVEASLVRRRAAAEAPLPSEGSTGGVASPGCLRAHNGDQWDSVVASSTDGFSIEAAAALVTSGSEKQRLSSSDMMGAASSYYHQTAAFVTPVSPEEEEAEAAAWSRLSLNNCLTSAEDLIARLDMCSMRIYSLNTNYFQEARDLKNQVLLQLMEAASDSTLFGREDVMNAAVRMISRHLFRPLPPSSYECPGVASLPFPAPTLETEEEDTVLDPAWPHRQLIYEFFLRFVINDSVDAKTAKRFIDHKFVLRLLELFASDDAREREYLKTILHRIYGKVMPLRSFIRKAIQQHFFRFMYEQRAPGVAYTYKGISELLEILGSIINGFALPLKEEHRTYLKHCLIPLHKARTFHMFNVQLSYCMTQYVEKDSRLSEPIIRGILKYWPVSNTAKEVIFLSELEEILELTPIAEFEQIMDPLFERLALCIESPHFQVSERVLFLWNNECLVQLFNNYKSRVFPVLISALYKNSKEHWNSAVHTLTYNVSKLLAESDPKLFDECSDSNFNAEELKQQELRQQAELWHDLELKVQRLPQQELLRAAEKTTANK